MAAQEIEMTPRPRIVVTNRIHDEVTERLANVGEVVLNQSPEPLSRRELQARLLDATAMMGFMTDTVDAALLAETKRLRIVACALKGFDSYDVEACTRAGVWVSIVPDLLTEPTAELALGLAISLGRQILEADTHVRAGHFTGWRPMFYGTGLHGSVVAVVGLGRVGKAIVDRLKGFGCAEIIGVDPNTQIPGVTAASLEQALGRSDYVFVAVPLGPDTLHLIGADELRVMKPGALLINVGRGSVVDEETVADALAAVRLGGYAADVFAFEDWARQDRPRSIPVPLLGSSRTVLTPHIGSAVARVRLAIEHRAADNIIAALGGKSPPDAVNQPV
jgi:phosphonate dehydrogenase